MSTNKFNSITIKSVSLTGGGNGETLYTSTEGTVMYDCGGASRTGLKLTNGEQSGQRFTVVNVSDANETITFATASTSHVAGGTSVIIGQNESIEFVYELRTNLWYPTITVPSSNPSHSIVFAGNFTTLGGDATETVTLTGALTTDIVVVSLKDNGTNNVTVSQAGITATNTLTIILSGDPSTDTVISYIVTRATH